MPYKDSEVNRAYQKQYRLLHKEKRALESNAYRESVKTTQRYKLRHAADTKRWRQSHPGHETFRRNTDIEFKLRKTLRSRLNQAIKKNHKKGSAVGDLGCSILEFINYIETKFTEGMTWENHGEWHLDHIKPLICFELSDRQQFLLACHYTNYQPLWAIDNLTKPRSPNAY